MENIDITINKKNIKHIYIRAKDYNHIVINAPLHVDNKYIYKIVKNKQLQIQKMLHNVKMSKNSDKKYKDGDNVYIFDMPYVLKTYKSNTNKVTLTTDKINLFVKDTSDAILKTKTIQKWQKKLIEKMFWDIASKYKHIIPKEVKRVSIKNMKTRWGSCNHTKGYINLNLTLIHYPLFCLEYVILHEMTHLLHPNHSKKFYAFISKEMPNYKEATKALSDKSNFYNKYNIIHKTI